MSTVLKVVGASWLQTKVSSYILGILGILAILALFVGQIERIQEDGNYAATVFYSEKTGYRIEYWGQSNELADIPRGVARAHFRMDVDTTGWSLLEVETNSSYPDVIQAYAAGVVEGALTWYLIHTHLENTIKDKCDDTPLEKQCNKLKDQLDKSVDIWKKYAEEHEDDPFWHQVSLHYTQVNGIFTGWKHGVERSLNAYETDISDLFWLNSIAEVPELQRKLNISIENTTLDNLPHLSSAFLRVVNKTADEGVLKMFLAQNSAGSYSSMARILKRYKLNYHLTASSHEMIPGTTVEFSGYPGSVTSQDEYYIIRGQGHKMAVTGTSLRNYNPKLWNEVNITDQVPVGPRISSANRLAVNISTWAHTMASSNSGTASKQWLIVDYARFDHLHRTTNGSNFSGNSEVVTETVNQQVRHTVVHRASSGHAKGLVMLVEQVPGLTHSADLSDAVLEQGYWATYGLPFFKDVEEATHIHKMEQTLGIIFSESESPRALLFKRGYKNATSLDSIIKLMRHNNGTAMNRTNVNKKRCDSELTCAVAEMGYWGVLGVRGDILEAKEAYGVIDTKIFSGTQHSSTTEFVAISAPPYTEAPQNITSVLLNKGNVAPIYTEQFNNKPDMDGLELEARDLVKHHQEEAKQKTLELLNRDVVRAFQWSESNFADDPHAAMPDKWAFGPFRPKWSW